MLKQQNHATINDKRSARQPLQRCMQQTEAMHHRRSLGLLLLEFRLLAKSRMNTQAEASNKQNNAMINALSHEHKHANTQCSSSV
jgi:hypothetical protein